MIYLDNAATTFPKPENVYKEMDRVNRELCVNAGRGAYKLARKAMNIIDETKRKLLRLISADSSVIVVFSPSITIAFNQIIFGIHWNIGDTIYISPYEHNAVARPLYYLSKKEKIKVKQLPIDKDTMEIDIEKMRLEFSKEKPNAIFCTHVSNVTGYILPIKTIFEEGKKYNSINVLDSAQSLGLIDINILRLDVDIIAFAGHKTLYGPIGIGGFANVSGIPIAEYIVGGTGSISLDLEMPQIGSTKYEAASENIVAIAGLNAALDEIHVEDNYRKEKELTNYFIDKFSAISNLKMYLPTNKEHHIGIVSFTLQSMSSEDIGMILDEDYDIAVRTGYHCAPFIHEYLNDKEYLGTVRVGLGKFVEKKDVDELFHAVNEIQS